MDREDAKCESCYREHRHKKGISDYIGSIIASILLMYIFNNLLNWHIGFLQSSFVAPLAIYNISFLTTIIANAIFIAFDQKWFVNIFKLVLSIIGFVATYTLYEVFPFQFNNPGIENIVRLVLIISLVVNAIVITVQAIKSVFLRP